MRLVMDELREPDDHALLDALEEARTRAEDAERSLARLQGSFTMTVGQLVIDAGQSRRQLFALPVTLLRMRRSRRATRATATQRVESTTVLEPRDASLRVGSHRLLLARRSVTLDTLPSIVLIGPAEFARAFAGRAHVSPALPHNASDLVRALDPDLVLVHAHAGTPDSVWFPLGEPGEAVRERAVIDVRETARRLGRPLVLIHDPVRAPGLNAFAATCDHVLAHDSPDLLAQLDELLSDRRD